MSHSLFHTLFLVYKLSFSSSRSNEAKTDIPYKTRKMMYRIMSKKRFRVCETEADAFFLAASRGAIPGCKEVYIEVGLDDRFSD